MSRRKWRQGAGAETQRPVVAIAHDYLTQRGGAERVVLAMHRAFPDATIYTALYDPDGTYPEFRDARIVTSSLNRFSAFRKDHRLALPFLAMAASALKIDADVVVVSSSGWAHGLRTTGRLFVYCHSPARWLYLTEQYLGAGKRWSLKGLLLAALKPGLIAWDRKAAARADKYVANSTVVEQRIRQVYGKRAEIFYPPHSIEVDGPLSPIEGLEEFTRNGHFIVVSRLLPYKNVDQAVAAFEGIPERLLVIGAGPLAEQIRASLPDNVKLASNVTDEQMRWAYASAKAVIAPSYEDFGITPLEGAAWGIPTIALRAGGYLDTIVEGVTGTFIDEPTAVAIREAVLSFRSDMWDSDAIRDHARSFAEEPFRDRLRDEVFELAKS